MPNSPIKLETPRLLLREFKVADAGLIFELNRQPEVLKYLHEPLLRDLQHARQILEEIILPQYPLKLGRWAIVTKENDQFIGWCGLKKIQETTEVDLGFRLHPFAWGKGFATEAAKACLEYGFEQLTLPEVFATAQAANLASISVLQKAGLQFLKSGEEANVPTRVFHATSFNPGPKKSTI